MKHTYNAVYEALAHCYFAPPTTTDEEGRSAMAADAVDVFVRLQDMILGTPVELSNDAIRNRDLLANYFMLEDPLSWQEALVMEDGYVSP